MRLSTKEFKDNCSIIKNAIDNKNVSLYNETLELKADGNTLCMNVTNREYYTTVKFAIPEAVQNFKAAVSAKLFLDLMSKITSETVELSVDATTLYVSGNGKYKLPLIFNNDVMLELPEITITNVSNTFNIASKTLQDILTFNSKELQRGTAVKPVQSYFYVDDQGCITFTSGACVNSFTLPQAVKILLSEKVVKLFKLFKDVENVTFSMGQDQLPNSTIVQQKVKFETPTVTITAISPDSTLISAVPVQAIRDMANKTYDYSAVVNREELLQVINRLMLFNNDKNYGILDFTNGKITITDWSKDNTEEIATANDCPNLTSYQAIVNLNGLSLILGGSEEETVCLCFGDDKAIVIKKPTISDIIPQLKQSA